MGCFGVPAGRNRLKDKTQQNGTDMAILRTECEVSPFFAHRAGQTWPGGGRGTQNRPLRRAAEGSREGAARLKTGGRKMHQIHRMHRDGQSRAGGHAARAIQPGGAGRPGDLSRTGGGCTDVDGSGWTAVGAGGRGARRRGLGAAGGPKGPVDRTAAPPNCWMLDRASRGPVRGPVRGRPKADPYLIIGQNYVI